jgi:hypothetical protein
MDELAAVRQQLGRLRAADPKLRLFGATTHRYHLNRCLSERAILAFEQAYGIALPDDYRAFIRYIGDGGAGPFYGICPLAKAVVLTEKSLLAQPFPHVHWWNGVQPPDWWHGLETHTISQDDIHVDEEAYFNDRHIQGSLRLAHEGCGHYRLLVVSGPERGHMWSDSRVSDQGIMPLPFLSCAYHVAGFTLISERDATTRMSFLTWYRRWLDAALAYIAGNRDDLLVFEAD